MASVHDGSMEPDHSHSDDDSKLIDPRILSPLSSWSPIPGEGSDAFACSPDSDGSNRSELACGCDCACGYSVSLQEIHADVAFGLAEIHPDDLLLCRHCEKICLSPSEKEPWRCNYLIGNESTSVSLMRVAAVQGTIQGVKVKDRYLEATGRSIENYTMLHIPPSSPLLWRYWKPITKDSPATCPLESKTRDQKRKKSCSRKRIKPGDYVDHASSHIKRFFCFRCQSAIAHDPSVKVCRTARTARYDDMRHHLMKVHGFTRQKARSQHVKEFIGYCSLPE